MWLHWICFNRYTLKNKNKIKIIDNQWFGKNISSHRDLKIVNKDIRNLKKEDFNGYDAIIHLANIANDPVFCLSLIFRGM